jgi:hypothetical protein
VPTERERDGPVGPLPTSLLFAGYVEKLNFLSAKTELFFRFSRAII